MIRAGMLKLQFWGNARAKDMDTALVDDSA